jgi:glycosyltransferase involved in cell wall biosynthesis
MVSIIIPSRNEKFLEATVKDILLKAAGDIEILVVLDGYEPPERIDDPRVRYIKNEKSVGMRAAINLAAAAAKGEYLMKIDAHCIVAAGFDKVLTEDCEDDMVMIPRRYRLDEDNWGIDYMVPPVDYEHFIYPPKFKPASLHGYRWLQRGAERKEVSIDDTLSFQGSCWFMKKSHFERHGFLQIEGYNGLPQQEAEEIGLTTWLSGGRVVVNKKTWYAHLFKGKKHGRGYHLSLQATRDCYAHSYNHWVHENKDGFIKLIERFWPLPGWRSNWKEKLWTR